jgi:hypothetical protein
MGRERPVANTLKNDEVFGPQLKNLLERYAVSEPKPRDPKPSPAAPASPERGELAATQQQRSQVDPTSE